MARPKTRKKKAATGKPRKSGPDVSAAPPARSRLLLVTPRDVAPDLLKETLAAALAGGDVAAILVRGTDDRQLRLRADAVLPFATSHNLAVLLDDAPELAAELGADGVQIPAELNRYRQAREILGTDRILGAYCGRSRHAAMELGEAGVDFVVFDEDELGEHPTKNGNGQHGESDDELLEEELPGFSLLGWWAEVFEVPCVAWSVPTEDAARQYASLGVEFIRPPDNMWETPQAARQSVERLNALFEEVASDASL